MAGLQVLNSILPLTPQAASVDISKLGTKIKLGTSFNFLNTDGTFFSYDFYDFFLDDNNFGKRFGDVSELPINLSLSSPNLAQHKNGLAGFLWGLTYIPVEYITELFDSAKVNNLQYKLVSYYPSYPLTIDGKKTIVYIQSYNIFDWGPKINSDNTRDDSTILINDVNMGVEIITQTFTDANTYTLSSVEQSFIDIAGRDHVQPPYIEATEGIAYDEFGFYFNDVGYSRTVQEFAIPAGLTFSNNFYCNASRLDPVGTDAPNYVGQTLYDKISSSFLTSFSGLQNYNCVEWMLSSATIE
jgi:hypothetical protein